MLWGKKGRGKKKKPLDDKIKVGSREATSSNWAFWKGLFFPGSEHNVVRIHTRAPTHAFSFESAYMTTQSSCTKSLVLHAEGYNVLSVRPCVWV